jgi:hypothetical protein
MRYKIQCTFKCEVEAEDLDAAFAEASDVFKFNEGHSDAVIQRDEDYEMEAWECD